MKVVVLSSYPLVDNHRYKKIVIDGLAALGTRLSDVMLVYGNTRLRDYYREAIGTFGVRDSFDKLRRNRGTAPRKVSESSEQAGTASASAGKARLEAVAKGHGMEVRKFGRLGEPACISLLRDFAPDVIHNLSGTYIPKGILEVPRHGVISGHYGLLPDIRGGDTIRWSILLNVPLAVSHMFLAPAMDMGDIINTEHVPVRRGDTIADLRHKCQLVNGRVHLELIEKVMDGTIVRVPQEKARGTRFYRMGRVMQEKVDAMLSRNLYEVYAE